MKKKILITKIFCKYLIIGRNKERRYRFIAEIGNKFSKLQNGGQIYHNFRYNTLDGWRIHTHLLKNNVDLINRLIFDFFFFIEAT